MRLCNPLFAVVVLAGAATCPAQEQPPVGRPSPVAAEPGAQSQPAQEAAVEKQPLIVNAGTRVRVALGNPLRTRLARRGDRVNAVTVFPVTVGATLAIPVGTYLDGTIEKLTKRGSGLDGMHIHFSHMVFSNGYEVNLDGSAAEAKAMSPAAESGAQVANRTDDGTENTAAPAALAAKAGAFQQPPVPPTPTLPPQPKLGPSPGAVVGAAVGVVAVGVVTAIALAHHRRNDVFLDAGTQFDLIVQTPLTLDPQRVADAMATAAAQ